MIEKLLQIFAKQKSNFKIIKYLKTEKMKKQLELNEHDALRLYPSASSEFKQILELNFGKEFFNKKITERINDYNDVLSIGNYNEKNDVVNIDNFDESENKVVRAFIKKMRISKVYRENWVAKRNERRWYPYYLVSSGFEFRDTFYDFSSAYAVSASRLCFPNEECAIDYAKKFIDVDKDFIDLQ